MLLYCVQFKMSYLEYFNMLFLKSTCYFPGPTSINMLILENNLLITWIPEF